MPCIKRVKAMFLLFARGELCFVLCVFVLSNRLYEISINRNY
jgi:hypothetical protein